MPDEDVTGGAVPFHARVGVELDDAPLVRLVARQPLGTAQQVVDDPMGAGPHRERAAGWWSVGDQADHAEAGGQQLLQGSAVQTVGSHVAMALGRPRRQVSHRQPAVDSADPLRGLHLAPAEELLGPAEHDRGGGQHGEDPRLMRRLPILPGKTDAAVLALLAVFLVGPKRTEPGGGIVPLHACRRTFPLALPGARHRLGIEHTALDQIPFALEEPDLVLGQSVHLASAAAGCASIAAILS